MKRKRVARRERKGLDGKECLISGGRQLRRFVILITLVNLPQAAFLKREGLDYSVVPPGEMTTELMEKLKQVALASGGAPGDKEEAAGATQVFYKVWKRGTYVI